MVPGELDDISADGFEQVYILWTRTEYQEGHQWIGEGAIWREWDFIADMGDICLCQDRSNIFSGVGDTFQLHGICSGTYHGSHPGECHCGEQGSITIRCRQDEYLRLQAHLTHKNKWDIK